LPIFADSIEKRNTGAAVLRTIKEGLLLFSFWILSLGIAFTVLWALTLS
jgi:hypothetical protein